MNAVAASHLALTVIMWLLRGDIRTQIAQQHPRFSPAELDDAASIATTSGVAFHLVLAVVYAFLAARLPRGFGLAIAAQVAGIVFSLVSWRSSPTFHPVIPILDVVQLATIVMLVRARRSAPEADRRRGSTPPRGADRHKRDP